VALAGSILFICPLIGKKNTTDHILPLFLQLLKDDDSEVRITLFKKLNEITKVLGLDILSQSVVPALTNLANDKNWRIRHSSIDIISFFAKELV
jgi:serine/threonine-protein phosphatase 2A regulatory subunit A